MRCVFASTHACPVGEGAEGGGEEGRMPRLSSSPWLLGEVDDDGAGRVILC